VTLVESEQLNAKAADAAEVVWPAKHDLFGVQVSATDCDELVDAMTQAARLRLPAVVSFHAVHAIVESIKDPELLAKVNQFDAVAPDGQPVRWALNHLHRTGLPERVYGPEAMARLCERAAAESISIYLYGGSQKVIDDLTVKLPQRFPGLTIAGAESPPFRALTAEEDADVVRRINDSGAGFVFVGLGCPKQDHFAADHADRIDAVLACVGAAFDFHAETKAMAPKWMQRNGLEWIYRLASEPRRLWRRYLQTNSVFLARWMVAACRRRSPAASQTERSTSKPR
jgi:N-acetylglucosaminyldiphosphoundecaprenol N-acetyl-beta-D-mannosaminyltransferase